MSETTSVAAAAGTCPELVDVDVRGVSKSFGGVPALTSVGLQVNRGEFVTLLGPSGCGKSTLLRIIAGLERQDDGEVYLSGRPMSGVPPHRRPVSMVFQSLALFPHLNVFQNVAYPLKMAKVPSKQIATQVEEYLRLIQLEGFGGRAVTELSGGQRQRVALARSLAHKPDVLLLDEPLSALDEKLRKQMQVELKRFQNRMGTTFVYVTHDQEEALVMSDRIAVFSKARIEQYGRPLEVYTQPATPFVATFVGETNLIAGALCRSDSGWSVETGSRSLPVADARGFEAGDRVWASIRPEHVRATRLGDGDPHSDVAVGTVSDVLFYGSTVKVSMEMDRGPLVMSRTDVGSFGAKLIAGERVTITWDPEMVCLVERREEDNGLGTPTMDGEQS